MDNPLADATPLKPRWLHAVAFFLAFQFPPYPSVASETTVAEFAGIRALGLLCGALFGRYISGPQGRFRSNRQALVGVMVLLVGSVGLTFAYFPLLDDVENYYYTTLSVLLLFDVCLGMLLFVAAPTLGAIVAMMKRR